MGSFIRCSRTVISTFLRNIYLRVEFGPLYVTERLTNHPTLRSICHQSFVIGQSHALDSGGSERIGYQPIQVEVDRTPFYAGLSS